MTDRATTRSWFRRYPVAVFLGALVLSFVSSPFEEAFRDGDLVEALRLTLVVLFGLLALSNRRRTLLWGIVLVTPALLGKWLNHWRPELVPAWIFLAPGLLFCGFVVLHLLRFILRAPRIDSEVLCAGVAGYLMVGLLWALAYILIARLSPSSFVFSVGPAASQSMKGFTAIYYSFITLTTVGYGDIVPHSGGARTLAALERRLPDNFISPCWWRAWSACTSSTAAVRVSAKTNRVRNPDESGRPELMNQENREKNRLVTRKGQSGLSMLPGPYSSRIAPARTGPRFPVRGPRSASRRNRRRCS